VTGRAGRCCPDFGEVLRGSLTLGGIRMTFGKEKTHTQIEDLHPN